MPGLEEQSSRPTQERDAQLNYSTVSSYLFFTTIFPIFFPTKKEKKQLKSFFILHQKALRAREESSTRHTKRDPFVVARYPHRWSSKNALAAKVETY